jgi:HAD superfamily hydrolase (TIGR01509 family)
VIKAIIFDLYGVLALNGWQAFKARHLTDKPATWDEVFELGRKVDAGLADYGELIHFTAKKTGESEATVRYQLEHTTVNDELLSYIATDLKPRYKLGILSNASSNIVSELFLPAQEQLFDAIVLSHHVGLTKPDAGMYEAIAEKLYVDTKECIFVDDQERHVIGAKAAGMQALVYEEVEVLRKEIQKRG